MSASERAERAVDSKASLGLRALWENAAALPHVSRGDVARHMLARAWNNIVRAPVTAAVSLFTIAVSLVLLACVVIVLHNIRLSLANTRQDLTLSLYLTEAATETEANLLQEELRKRPEVEAVTVYGKKEALRQFRSTLGDQAAILEGLDERNPLPVTVEVRVRAGDEGSAVFETLASEFRGRPEVEMVQYSRGLLHQLNTLVRSFTWGAVAAVLVVLLLTGFIISNTIRLALYSHRDEIEIMRLVGATDHYIRAPYLIEGAIQGLAAGVVGVVLAFGLFLPIRVIAMRLNFIDFSGPTLEFLPWSWTVAIIVTGAAVGLLGSWLAVRRFLPE